MNHIKNIKISRIITLIICRILWILRRPFFLYYSIIKFQKKNIEKILILAWGGIGNVILLTPVFKNLRINFPLSEIFVVVNPNGSKEILEGAPWVDNIIEQKDNGLKNIFLRARETRIFGKITLCITMVGIDPLVGTLYSLFSGAKYRIGESGRAEGFFYTHTIKVEPEKHEVERNLALLKKLNLTVEDDDITFQLPHEIKINVYNELKKNGLEKSSFITIAPGSGETQKFKRWPKEYFVKVSKWFIENGLNVVLLGSLNEQELCEDIKRLCGVGVYNMAGKFSLKKTAGVISYSRMMISNDNGLMHISASLKIPLVAIFGPTLYYKNEPRKVPHRIIRNKIDCSPCYNFQVFSCKYNIKCLTELYPEVVIQSIKELNNETKCLDQKTF